MVAKVLLFAVLFFLATAASHARRYRHNGPSGDEVRKHIRGRVLSNVVEGTGGKMRLAEVNLDLLGSVVSFDELKLDKIKVQDCVDVDEEKRTHFNLKAPDAVTVDMQDFQAGTFFSISRNQWSASCNKNIPDFDDLPNIDPTLFFKITRSVQVDKMVKLHARMVSRFSVIDGDINVKVLNEYVNPDTLPRKILFDDTEDGLEQSRMFSPVHQLLPTVSKASLSVNKNFDFQMSSAISATANFSLTTGIEDFDINFGLTYKKVWFVKIPTGVKVYGDFDVVLEADAGAGLSVKTVQTVDYDKQLYKQSIPSLGFSLDIPFIGDVGAGAFTAVDFVADVEAKLKADFSVFASVEKRERVSFKLFPSSSFSTSTITDTNSGKTAITSDAEYSASAELTGFAGLRPKVGLEIKIGSIGDAEVGLGISAGVEAAIKASTSGYRPVSTGITVGVCDVNHRLQGGLSVLIKDLSLDYDVSFVGADGSISILDEVYRYKFLTYCGFEE